MIGLSFHGPVVDEEKRAHGRKYIRQPPQPRWMFTVTPGGETRVAKRRAVMKRAIEPIIMADTSKRHHFRSVRDDASRVLRPRNTSRAEGLVSELGDRRWLASNSKPLKRLAAGHSDLFASESVYCKKVCTYGELAIQPVGSNRLATSASATWSSDRHRS